MREEPGSVRTEETERPSQLLSRMAASRMSTSPSTSRAVAVGVTGAFRVGVSGVCSMAADGFADASDTPVGWNGPITHAERFARDPSPERNPSGTNGQ